MEVSAEVAGVGVGLGSLIFLQNSPGMEGLFRIRVSSSLKCFSKTEPLTWRSGQKPAWDQKHHKASYDHRQRFDHQEFTEGIVGLRQKDFYKH